MLAWRNPKIRTTRTTNGLQVIGKNEAMRQMLDKARAERKAQLRDQAAVDRFLLRIARVFTWL